MVPCPCSPAFLLLLHATPRTSPNPNPYQYPAPILIRAASQAANAQVRDYSFSPDSGRVDALRFDALGMPAIPEAVLTVLEARPCIKITHA